MNRFLPVVAMGLLALIPLNFLAASIGATQDLPKATPAQQATAPQDGVAAPQGQAQLLKSPEPAPFTTKDRKKGWKVVIPGNRPLTPPALVNDKVFLGTTFGEVYCLAAETGELLWNATIGEPIVFQPALAKGRIYLSTNLGHLYCIETGDTKDDGWLMWGADAGHNGLAK